MTRALAALCVSALLAAGALAPAAPAQARTAATTYAATAVTATNQARARNDVRAVAADACLQERAAQQARRMARQGRLFHQDLGGVQQACGVGYAAENVAVGYRDGRAVVTGWLRSPGHRTNLLNGRYRLVGVAAVKGKGRWWVAQVFGTEL